MFITIAVIAYNEEKTIKNILDDISRQDYDHNASVWMERAAR